MNAPPAMSEEPTIYANTEEEMLATYHRLSPAAVASFVLGIFSFLSYLNPVLYLLPIVAVAAGVAALRGIANESQRLSGRSLAVWGITLAVFFGSWAPAKYVFQGSVLYPQARSINETWLETIQNGDIYLAYEQTLDFSSRHAEGTNLENLYSKRQEAEEALSSFRDRPLVQLLTDKEKNAEVRFHRNVHHQKEDGRFAVEQDFIVDYTEDGKARSKIFRLIAMRGDYNFGPDWQVKDAIDVEQQAHRLPRR